MKSNPNNFPFMGASAIPASGQKTGLWLGLTLVLVLATAVAGGLLWRQRTGDTLAHARRAGVIRIGYAVEAPYAYLTSDGKVTGEGPEIARVIAARLGVPRVEWRLAEFGDLIEGLNNGRFDVIAAGMFITPERQQLVAFSTPTFQAGPGLLVRKGNPLALHSYADLVCKPRARVAVLNGSVEETQLLQLGCSAAKLVRVPDAASGRAAVRSGEADALALSAPTLRWMTRNPLAGRTETAEPFIAASGNGPSQPAFGGFAFRKDDRALREAWNAELARFVGGYEHCRIVAPFGFTAAELPSGPFSQLAAPKP